MTTWSASGVAMVALTLPVGCGLNDLFSHVPAHAPAAADVDDDLPFRVGAKLRHARWGEGLLVGIQREGSDVIATVHFASVGRKRLSLEYAHLEEL